MLRKMSKVLKADAYSKSVNATVSVHFNAVINWKISRYIIAV